MTLKSKLKEMSSDFSRTQQVALAIAPKVTSVLSLFGSGWIAIEVLTKRSKRTNVYNRLLCAMSLCDILVSSWFFLSTWPIPEGTPGVAFDTGTQASCTAQGFFVQFGITSPVYNSCLAVYYLLVVRYGVTEDTLKGVEPIFHILALSFGLGTSFTGLGLDLYNSANLWCWIAPLPSDCLDSKRYGDETNCTRGNNAWIYRWAFYFAPLWFFIVFVTCIMVCVYMSIRRREIKAIRVSQKIIAEKGPGNRDTTNGRRVVRSSFMHTAKPSTTHNINIFKTRQQRQQQRNAGRRSRFLRGYAETAKQSSRMVIPQKLASKIVVIQNSSRSFKPTNHSRRFGEAIDGASPKSDEDKEDEDCGECAEYVISTLQTFPTAHQQNLEANSFGSRIVFRQSLLYCLVFYLTFTFATINRFIQQVTGQTYFGVIFLHSIFIPLQGFFNVIVYRYAYYFRLKHRNPHMTEWELFQHTWRWSFLGPPPNSRQRPQQRKSMSSSAFENPNRPNIQQQLSNIPGNAATRDSRPSTDQSLASVSAGQEHHTLSSAMADDSAMFSTELDNTQQQRIDSEDIQTFSGMIADDVYAAAGSDSAPGEGLNYNIYDMNDDDCIYDVMSDLMVTYSDYPNVLSDDAIMVATNFPIIVIGDDD